MIFSTISSGSLAAVASRLSSLERLSDAFAEILSESRERYLLSYTPTGVPAGGWHDVIVRVPGRRAEVRARPGYLAP